MHDARAGFFGLCVVLFDHVPHEWWLARKIDVVGPVFGAGRDKSFAIKLIGANGCDDNTSALGHRVNAFWIGRVCLDQCCVCRQPHLIADLGQLGGIASGHRPRQIRIGGVHVFRHKPAREARGPVNDHVKFGHASVLPFCCVLAQDRSASRRRRNCAYAAFRATLRHFTGD